MKVFYKLKDHLASLHSTLTKAATAHAAGDLAPEDHLLVVPMARTLFAFPGVGLILGETEGPCDPHIPADSRAPQQT